MDAVKLLLRLIVLTAMMATYESIKCFQCNSQRDPDCAILGSEEASMNISKYYYDCPGDAGSNQRHYFCRKVLQTVYDRNQLEVVSRTCGWELHPHLACYRFENKGHAEVVCQCFQDGCNTATRPAHVYFIAGAMFVLLAAVK